MEHPSVPCREIFETSLERPYQSRRFETKRTIKWGQRKLLLSEIQFLTHFWDVKQVPQPVIVYAGAAPGTHIPFLSCLFPEITFHLYDPRAFNIAATDKIVIHQELFGDAQKYFWTTQQMENENVFLISDIRTGDLKVDTDPQVYESKIWNDMLLQQDWVRTIQPVSALLKFRLPYGQGRRGERQATVDYLDGRLFTQCFSGSTSSETRLVPCRKVTGSTPGSAAKSTQGSTQGSTRYQMKKWNVFRYENQMFKHNTIDRECQSFLNPLTNRCGPIAPPELLSDHDSVSECLILKEYITKMAGSEEDLLYHVPRLSRLITLNLSRTTRLSELRELKWGNAFNEARIYQNRRGFTQRGCMDEL